MNTEMMQKLIAELVKADKNYEEAHDEWEKTENQYIRADLLRKMNMQIGIRHGIHIAIEAMGYKLGMHNGEYVIYQ